MQPNDCYLTEEQKHKLKLMADWISVGKMPPVIHFAVNKTAHYTHKALIEDVDEEIRDLLQSLSDLELNSFVDCGFLKVKPASNHAYYIQHGYILNCAANNFAKAIPQMIVQASQKSYKGLSEEHWNFLVLLKNAKKGKYLTQKSKTIFYIRPIEEDGKIVNFDGFAPIFLNAHRTELCVSLKIFLELVSLGYLEKARYGHYHIKDKRILPAVDDYLTQTGQGVTEITNSAFRLPDTSPQFQCDIFMVMPFREHLNPVYTDHIKKLAENLNYSIKRGDDPFSHHDIITEIWSLINNARLIIADCTDKNANVFYEMGLAHAIGKPVIVITQKEEDIPFDIRQRRFIKYEYTPRGMKQFEDELEKAIQNILGEGN